MVANVGAQAHRAAAEITPLLVEQVCAPVRWVEVEALKAEGATELLELGPGRALAGMVRRIDKTRCRRRVWGRQEPRCRLSGGERMSIALVTGASRGMGAIACALAQSGSTSSWLTQATKPLQRP